MIIQEPVPHDKVGAPRVHGGGVPQKWILDDRGRRLIMDLYDGTPARTDMIQRQMPHIPRSIIREWARKLGKAHSRSRWTADEEEILRRHLGKISMRQLEKKLHKCRTNIVEHARAMGLYKEKNEDGYTLEDLKLAFAVHDDTLRLWVKKGWLKGRKIKQEFNREIWSFKDKDIRDFVLAHPEQINPKKFDWLWIVDIISGDIGLGEIGPQRKGESP